MTHAASRRRDREPDPRAAAASRGLTVSGVILALSMFALGALVIVDGRRDAWHQAELAASNLVRALEHDITRNVSILDLSIQGVGERLSEPGIDQASPGVRRHALFDRAAGAEDVGAVLVMDRDGNIVEDSTSAAPTRVNRAAREQFAVHRDRPDVGLFVSRPYVSQVAEGDFRISLSRRLSSPGGDFAGVVEGALRLTYFRRLFDQLDIGPRGTITLVSTSGQIIVRHPFHDGDIGRDVSHNEAFARFMAAPSGQFIGRATVDKVERLFTFRRVGDLPLILAVNMSVDDIYAAWWRKAFVMGSILVLLCAATVTLCVLFRREIGRRAEAERALLAAADELSVMASVDGLTGLANRRTCETELDARWRRAIDGRSPVSLLMLDVDHFKLFNDRHGHQEGDRALRAVAMAMKDGLLHPGDLAVRYGGEEFLAILPGTDAAGALAVAERVRASVEELAIPHAGNPKGVVTVSIGVATLRPLAGDASAGLVKAADEALYAAKRAGRNRIGIDERRDPAASAPATRPDAVGLAA